MHVHLHINVFVIICLLLLLFFWGEVHFIPSQFCRGIQRSSSDIGPGVELTSIIPHSALEIEISSAQISSHTMVRENIF